MFDTPKERSEARAALHGFDKLAGWKLILAALKDNIEQCKRQLRERKDFANLEEVFYLQQRISDIEKFTNLPETLLRAAQEDEEEPEEEPIYDEPATEAGT